MSKCSCIRTATAADDRAYEAEIARRGGRGSREARAWIEEQHRLFKATERRCRQQHGFWSW